MPTTPPLIQGRFADRGAIVSGGASGSGKTVAAFAVSAGGKSS